MPEGEALWSGSVTHRFLGDTLLFLGFSSSFRFGTMKTKELGLFFFLNLAARKKEDKRRNVFLFFHLFALCADWTLVALTAGFNFFSLWVGGAAREEEKPWTEKNLGEHRLVCYFKLFSRRLSAFQLLPGYSSDFKLKSLLLIRAKCLMLWDHSEHHLSDSPRNQPLFLVSGQSSPLFPLSSSPSTQAQGWEVNRIGNTTYFFNVFLFLIGGVDMHLQFTHTVNTCI